jgi:hypothetical protein
MERARANKTITEKQHTRHAIFIPWFGQVTLAYFHVVASQWTRVALNPFQVIQWSTWIPRSFILSILPFARNLHKLEPLTLTKLWSQRKHKSKDGRATHARLKSAAHTRTQVKKWAHKHSSRSLQLEQCSTLKNDDPIMWMQSLGVLGCFL